MLAVDPGRGARLIVIGLRLLIGVHGAHGARELAPLALPARHDPRAHPQLVVLQERLQHRRVLDRAAERRERQRERRGVRRRDGQRA